MALQPCPHPTPSTLVTPSRLEQWARTLTCCDCRRRSPALFLSFAVVSGTVGYGFWRIINDPEYTASHKSAPTPEEVAAK